MSFGDEPRSVDSTSRVLHRFFPHRVWGSGDSCRRMFSPSSSPLDVVVKMVEFDGCHSLSLRLYLSIFFVSVQCVRCRLPQRAVQPWVSTFLVALVWFRCLGQYCNHVIAGPENCTLLVA